MMYRYQPRTMQPDAIPFWVRHPHMSGFLTFIVGPLLAIALVLMLTGCDDFWRCTPQGRC